VAGISATRFQTTSRPGFGRISPSANNWLSINLANHVRIFNQLADLNVSLNICLESECGANLWLLFSTFPTSIIHAALQYREQ